MFKKNIQEDLPVVMEETVTAEELQQIRALIPEPPRTYTCGLCLVETLEREVPARSINRNRNKSTVIGNVEVCLMCSYYGDFPGDSLSTLKDLAVAKLLGFPPGSYLVGMGELLPAPPKGQKGSDTPFAWVDVENLAHAFDVKYSTKTQGYLSYPDATLEPVGYMNREYLVLGDPVFVPNDSPVLPSPLRPLTPGEKAETLKQQAHRNERAARAAKERAQEARIERAKAELAAALAVRI